VVLYILEAIMEWFISALKKYAVFSGRAQRKEYWFFILFNCIFYSILGLLTLVPILRTIFEIISYGYSIALIIPMLAVSVRRLHDIDRSGFSLFFVFIPIAGIIILLKFLTRNGSPDENQYGANPKILHGEDITENIPRERKNQKRLLVPVLITLAVLLMALFYFSGFKSIGSKEQFVIWNNSNDKYYLNIVSERSITQFSLKRYEQINGVKYIYIWKSGKYRLGKVQNIFQCERDDGIDIATKFKNAFNEFRIVDENDNVLWVINNENFEKIGRMGGFGQVFWNLWIE
jgi:uncharacterized membrane protein YhaH (DUF805 family)